MVLPSFAKPAMLTGVAAGMPEVRVAVYPGAIDHHTHDEMAENIRTVLFDQIVEALTKAPPDEGKHEKKGSAASRSSGIVMKGTYEAIQDYFVRQGWTDGVAVAPPTKEAVEAMLKWTNDPPDKVLGVLPMADLVATPWSVAVNGVMAGCRPEHMPILIAAVEAIADERYALRNIGTTATLTPFLLINGPIVKRLDIKYGIGLISRPPNTSIGRALGLIIRNIAGFSPGEFYMGTWGYFPPFVLAEDEDRLKAMGWKPFHAEHGFDSNSNTVTAAGTFNWGFQVFPTLVDPEPILKLLAWDLGRKVATEVSHDYGMSNTATVLLTPPTAKVLADAGYSKRDVARRVWQHAKISVKDKDWVSVHGGRIGVTHGEDWTVHGMAARGEYPEWANLGPDDMVQVLKDPDLVNVVVCGDADRNKAMSLWTCYLRPTTKEIRLPVSWDK